MGTFILKRKNYVDAKFEGINSGVQIQNAKGISGIGKNIALNTVTSPVMVAGMAADSINDKVKGVMTDIKDTASGYTPTVRNAFVPQKNYSVGQAIKEIGVGLGKGTLNWGKSNTKEFLGLAKWGAGFGAAGYAMNRLKRQKAENEAGIRKTDGMSNLGKLGAAAGTLGGTYYAYNKGTTPFKKGRNAVLAAGILGTASYMANNMLRQPKNKAKAQPSQSTYSFKDAAALGRKALGGKSFWSNIRSGNWRNIGRASKDYTVEATRSSVNGVSNFLTPGKGGADGFNKTIADSLSKQGKYGKKAGDWIRNHRATSNAIAAATVGTTVFGAANALGEKPTEAVTNALDRKTANFVKTGTV